MNDWIHALLYQAELDRTKKKWLLSTGWVFLSNSSWVYNLQHAHFGFFNSICQKNIFFFNFQNLSRFEQSSSTLKSLYKIIQVLVQICMKPERQLTTGSQFEHSLKINRFYLYFEFTLSGLQRNRISTIPREYRTKKNIFWSH
jgi:hypothetical protein